MPTTMCAQRAIRVSQSRRYASKLLGTAAEAGIAPRRAFEGQVVVLLRVRDAEAVSHHIQKRRRWQRDPLVAIPSSDVEDGFIKAGSSPLADLDQALAR